MADILNAQAVKFANEKARKIADAIETLDRTCQQFLMDVVPDFEEIQVVIDAANSDKIVDGSATDGRRQVTKVRVAELKYVVEQIIACMATDDRREVVHRWVTDGRPLY